jgi:hypothetical protein
VALGLWPEEARRERNQRQHYDATGHDVSEVQGLHPMESARA